MQHGLIIEQRQDPFYGTVFVIKSKKEDIMRFLSREEAERILGIIDNKKEEVRTT